MKQPAILLLVLVLIASKVSHLLAQQGASRTIFWLEGPSLTSSPWREADRSARLKGYKYFNFNNWPYKDSAIYKTIPAWAEFFNSKGRTDILGIGHDAGGLILRYMNTLSPNSGLSAMILDGVPNQGAHIMEEVLPHGGPSSTSLAQRFLNRLMDLRSGVKGCNACRMLEAVQRWLGHFREPINMAYYPQLRPNSSVVQNLGLPTIPHAVIWGNEDEEDGLILTRLIASWHHAGLYGEDRAYLDCYRKEVDNAARKAKDKKLKRLAEDVLSFGVGVVKLIEGIVSTNPVEISAGITSFSKTITESIRARKDINEQLREALECELIHQGLNAYWNLKVSRSNFVEDTVVVVCIPCDECADDPDPQVVAYCFSVCTGYGCEPGTPLYSYPVSYYQYEPHDGLLTRSEQLLAGAAKTYEAQKVNHFQEQFWEYTPIGNAFQDLFNGGAGAAFVVPK
jgi:hypothetical protein